MMTMIVMGLLRSCLSFAKEHPILSYALLAVALAILIVWGAISFVSVDLEYFILYIALAIFVLLFVAFLFILLRNSHSP